MMVPRLPAEVSPQIRAAPVFHCGGTVHRGDDLSYTPHIQMLYRIAEPGEITNGRLIQIGDVEGGRVDVLMERGHSGARLLVQMNQVWTHLIVDGPWRQRWTQDGRMDHPAQGLGLFMSRWERVPRHKLPDGHAVWAVERDGSCLWLVEDDECTRELQTDVNDLFLRLAGDGLWIQAWLNRRTAPPARYGSPHLSPPAAPLIPA